MIMTKGSISASCNIKHAASNFIHAACVDWGTHLLMFVLLLFPLFPTTLLLQKASALRQAKPKMQHRARASHCCVRSFESTTCNLLRHTKHSRYICCPDCLGVLRVWLGDSLVDVCVAAVVPVVARHIVAA